jgi:hypothetical protein
MIRLLAIALALANLIVLGLALGLFDGLWPRGREPQRVVNQVAPDKLRVLPVTPPASEGEVAPPSPAPQSAPAPAGGGAAVSTPGGSAAAVAVAAEPMCVEAGPLDDARAERIREWARGLREGLRADIERRAEPASFLVYLPPSADAQRRITQLRQAGVADIYLIGDGPLRQAISLGIFRSQEGARARQGDLAARGVQGTRIGPGPARADRLVARLARDPAAADAAWREALVRFQGLAGVEPVACSSG